MELKEIELPLNAKRIFFAGLPPNIISELRVTNISLFSMNPYSHVKYIYDNILTFFTAKKLSTMVVNDICSCIGGNEYYMHSLFKQINAIELSPLHCEILKHNLSKIAPNNTSVNIINANYLDIKDTLPCDIAMIDPPWDGPDYKLVTDIELYLRKDNTAISLVEIIKDLQKKDVKLVVVKLPANYNIKKILDIYPYYLLVPILHYKNGKTMYQVVILSKFLSIKKYPKREYFRPFNYRPFI